VSGTSNGYRPAAGARTAASLLLLRDGQDGQGALEVLMLRRAERDGDARSGAAVFPGGVLDSRDREAHAHCHGPSDAQASATLGVAEGGLDYMVAAVRETFEEVGLLLVSEAVADLGALHPWRERLQRGEVSAADFCRANHLTLDLSGLVYCAHWLTPPGTPKRFDTRFFMAHAPAGQVAQADLGEAVELMWLTPQAALDPARRLKLLPVTRRTLEGLARHATSAQAVAAARALPEVPLIMPRRAITAAGPGVVLPQEWAYAEVGRLDPEGRGDAHATLVAGRVVRLSPRVLRITAPNPGPMTGPGTNSYLVGDGTSGGWTVIDPGPDLPGHGQALLAAAAGVGGRIERILVTHTHRDHSPAARALAAATGAPVWGRVAAFPEGQDPSFLPAHTPAHGECITLGAGCTLRVVHTPGHASNHLCYLLEEERLLFTGDHVMQGSTVVINPPDGDMVAYLGSLQALLAEDLEWLAPGHGFLVAEPHAVLRALIAHRLKREAKVLVALQATHRASLAELLPRVYDDVPAALHPVAARSLLAHLLKLEHDGVAAHGGGHWSAR
jgi:glyoxylase-like metal-dependent hydrolase (beta-lactamase superfamily II)/8-oxo-dGTP pyrophosphatase MutT (NUDIX family)